MLDEALAQLPAAYRKDLLVTIDGARYSHQVIEHPDQPQHLPRARPASRRVELLGRLADRRPHPDRHRPCPATAWTSGLGADGKPETDAQVAGLTAILRHGLDGDRLDGWPPDMRIIARRTPRPVGQQPQLGEDPDWCFGAFATNTIGGQLHAWLHHDNTLPVTTLRHLDALLVGTCDIARLLVFVSRLLASRLLADGGERLGECSA